MSEIFANFQVFNGPGEYIFNRDRIPFAESFLIWTIGVSIVLFVLCYVVSPIITEVVEESRNASKEKRRTKNKHISEKCRVLYPYRNDGYDIVIFHSINLADSPAKTTTKIKSLMVYEPNILAYIDMDDNFRLIKDWCGYQVKEPYGPSDFINPESLNKAKNNFFKQ